MTQIVELKSRCLETSVMSQSASLSGSRVTQHLEVCRYTSKRLDIAFEGMIDHLSYPGYV